MKALRTVAVALGITLGAMIIIPLIVLAGLFVWLKLTEEDDEDVVRLNQAVMVFMGLAVSPGTARKRE